MQTVGFIGVGMIGMPMAQNILKGGHPLTAYDLDPEPGPDPRGAGGRRGPARLEERVKGS